MLFRNTYQYHLMLFPGIVILFIYTIIPFFGNIIAFQNFQPIHGFLKSEWVGLENFLFMFKIPDTALVFRNTLVIAVGKIVFTLLFSIIFAVLLNEARGILFKKTVQTICFLPHFLSWVILANIFKSLLDGNGLINQALINIGAIQKPIVFLGSNDFFQGIIISTDVWKEFGYGSIIFMAALAGINLELYEAAALDGAGRRRRIWHITLPGIRTTMVLVATLNVASVLNAGFDQIFNLYSPIIYQTGDVIDTYVYRVSFVDSQYSLGAAVGVLKSVIGLILITSSYLLAKKFANYRIF